MISDPIAIETYTVRAEAERDILGTLRRLAAIGYCAVEFAGIGNLVSGGSGAVTVADVRAALHDLGMRTTSVMVALPSEALLGMLADGARVLGAEYAVLSWVPEEWRRTASDVGRPAGFLNQLAENLRGQGLRFSAMKEKASCWVFGLATPAMRQSFYWVTSVPSAKV